MVEAVFSAVFLLLGCGGLVWMLSDFVVPEWRVNHEFIETTCQVLGKQIVAKDGDKDGVLYRPEIRIRYEVDGVVYKDRHYDISYYDRREGYISGQENAQAILDGFELYSVSQKTYPCWYDPANPGVAVLVRGYGWASWLIFTVPVSFIIIGAGGLIHVLLHWGKSAERRALMAQRVGQRERDLFGANGAGHPAYPAVPQGADMTNSPGTKLKFRLPTANSPGWALFGTLAFCIAWNGIVAAFVTMAVRSYFTDKPDWLLTLFIIPFAGNRSLGDRRPCAPVVGCHRHWTDLGRDFRSSAVSRRAVSRVPFAIGMADGESASSLVGLAKRSPRTAREPTLAPKPERFFGRSSFAATILRSAAGCRSSATST